MACIGRSLSGSVVGRGVHVGQRAVQVGKGGVGDWAGVGVGVIPIGGSASRAGPGVGPVEPYGTQTACDVPPQAARNSASMMSAGDSFFNDIPLQKQI
jgi:hypothetical protein